MERPKRAFCRNALVLTYMLAAGRTLDNEGGDGRKGQGRAASTTRLAVKERKAKTASLKSNG